MVKIPAGFISAILLVNSPSIPHGAEFVTGERVVLASSDRQMTRQSPSALRQQSIQAQPQSRVSSGAAESRVREIPGSRIAPSTASPPDAPSRILMYTPKPRPPVAQSENPVGNDGRGTPNGRNAGVFSPAANTARGAFPPAGTAGGALTGASLLDAFAGREILAGLDPGDRSIADHTARNALESLADNGVVGWASPTTGSTGAIIPLRTSRLPDWTPCRDYQMTLTIGGRSEVASGSACRSADGSWRMKR